MLFCWISKKDYLLTSTTKNVSSLSDLRGACFEEIGMNLCWYCRKSSFHGKMYRGLKQDSMWLCINSKTHNFTLSFLQNHHESNFSENQQPCWDLANVNINQLLDTRQPSSLKKVDTKFQNTQYQVDKRSCLF